MKKSSFAAMIMGTVGGILLSLGMCMCLLEEWNAFMPGVVMGCVGIVVLLAMTVVWRRLEGKERVKPNAKTILSILLGIIGAILLGVGMCLVMVWESMIFGIAVGLVGIVVLLTLIPLVKGFKPNGPREAIAE